MKLLLSTALIILSIVFLGGTHVRADAVNGTTFSISKTASPETVAPSSIVNFAITIKNISTSNSAPQKVEDILPAGFTYNNDAKLTDLSGIQSDFVAQISQQTLTWLFEGSNLQSIPQDQNIVISYSATSSPTAGTYSNQACLRIPEDICSTASIIVGNGTTPVTGVIDDIGIFGGTGVGLISLAFYLYRERKGFEEKTLSKL